jgi:heme-degrading monooxygenase HmoA
MAYDLLAATPQPPYYAVIFTSIRTDVDNGYEETSLRMIELARLQEGFLGYESAKSEVGITVSYWKDLESIKKWKANVEHRIAQERGKKEWYSSYKVRIARVEREYERMNNEK